MSKLIFLGTGTSQGVPMIGCRCEVCTSADPRDKRLRSSVFIEYNGVKFVIDTGPDFRYQMLRENITDIDAILFTHPHKDHTAGLDDVRAYNYFLDRSIDIYAEAHTMKAIKNEFSYAFADGDKYPGVPEITPHIITTEPFTVKGITVIPIRGIHLKMPVLGFRIGDIGYITDMNKIEDRELEKLKGCTLLVVDALRKSPHLSHFSLSEAIEVAKKTGAKETYFTHISHQMGLYTETTPELPPHMHLSYDRLTIDSEKL